MKVEPNKILIFFGSFVLFLTSCIKNKGELLEPQVQLPPTLTYCDSVNVTYAGTIQPIIQTKCLDLGCHGGGYASGDLLNYASVKVKVDNGTLKERTLVKKDMPSLSAPLSLTEQKKIQCWLDKGAPNN